MTKSRHVGCIANGKCSVHTNRTASQCACVLTGGDVSLGNPERWRWGQVEAEKFRDRDLQRWMGLGRQTDRHTLDGKSWDLVLGPELLLPHLWKSLLSYHPSL